MRVLSDAMIATPRRLIAVVMCKKYCINRRDSERIKS